MMLKLEIDLAHALQSDARPLWEVLHDLFETACTGVTEPGAIEGNVELTRWEAGKRVPVIVGKWELE